MCRRSLFAWHWLWQYVVCSNHADFNYWLKKQGTSSLCQRSRLHGFCRAAFPRGWSTLSTIIQECRAQVCAKISRQVLQAARNKRKYNTHTRGKFRKHSYILANKCAEAVQISHWRFGSLISIRHCEQKGQTAIAEPNILSSIMVSLLHHNIGGSIDTILVISPPKPQSLVNCVC